jgi:Uncharacterized protein conserved in bacteria (DUF2188)
MPPAAQTITDIREAGMSASTVHVEPNPKGRWIVRRDDEREPLSEHESATEAAHIARELAQLEGTSLVLLHDRYARTQRLHGECGQSENQTPRRRQRAAQLQGEREARSGASSTWTSIQTHAAATGAARAPVRPPPPATLNRCGCVPARRDYQRDR